MVLLWNRKLLISALLTKPEWKTTRAEPRCDGLRLQVISSLSIEVLKSQLTSLIIVGKSVRSPDPSLKRMSDRMATKRELAAKAIDVAARSIDLLAVLTKVAQDAEIGALIMKEIGRWLGK